MAWDDSDAEDDWGERRARDVCFRLEVEFTLQYSRISHGVHPRLLQTVLIYLCNCTEKEEEPAPAPVKKKAEGEWSDEEEEEEDEDETARINKLRFPVVHLLPDH